MIKTYAWAYEHDLIMTSGSDFHEKEDLALGGIITEYDIKTENDSYTDPFDQEITVL